MTDWNQGMKINWDVHGWRPRLKSEGKSTEVMPGLKEDHDTIEDSSGQELFWFLGRNLQDAVWYVWSEVEQNN